MHVGMVGKQFLLMRLQNSETFGGGTVKRRCAMSEPGHTASLRASTSHRHIRSPVLVVETSETRDF